jgi:hypothetical protein
MWGRQTIALAHDGPTTGNNKETGVKPAPVFLLVGQPKTVAILQRSYYMSAREGRLGGAPIPRHPAPLSLKSLS